MIWFLAGVGALLSGAQQLRMHRSNRAPELRQAAVEAKVGRDQQQAREKPDSRLRRLEDARSEPGNILKFLQTPQPAMGAKQQAAETSKTVEEAMHR